MKKYIILIGVIFIGAFIGYLLTRKQPISIAPQVPQPTPSSFSSLQEVPLIPVTPFPGQAATTTFTFSFVPPQLPTKLPIYLLNYPIQPLGQIQSIAPKLGFSGQPTILNEALSRYYTWSSPDGSALTFQETPPLFSLRKEVPLKELAPTVNEANETVLSFLKTYNFIDSTISLVPLESNYFRVSGSVPVPVTKPVDGGITYVAYKYSLRGYPLYLQPTSSTDVTSFVAANKVIQSISFPIIPSFAQQPEVSLIPLEKAMLALQNNKGVLVDIQQKKISEASPSISVTHATISKAQLVYMRDTTKNTVKPVYAFSGIGRESGKSPTVQVMYFVAATTN